VIEKALILSAGQGKRLLPLTEQRPKCLLPFNGRTLIEWQIAGLASNGIRDVTVVTGFHADAVEAALRSRPADGTTVRTLFNPFFAVADNVGSCFMARAMMLSGPFVLMNGDTLFHPLLLARAIAQASGPIAVTVDKKARYDADDMKVHCEGDRLIRIGKDLTEAEANAESIGMLFFSAEGGKLFAAALERAMRDPSGLKRWYLSVIDTLAKESHVRIASIQGLEWCEVDYPKDLSAAGNLTARLWREQTALSREQFPPAQTGGVR
jgi:L-glutamine-phosphate cytidylyltransferase